MVSGMVPCEAGCHSIGAQVEQDEEWPLVYVYFYVGQFYAGQVSWEERWRKRIAIAWTALRGKDFLFEDIVLSRENAGKLATALQGNE